MTRWYSGGWHLVIALAETRKTRKEVEGWKWEQIREWGLQGFVRESPWTSEEGMAVAVRVVLGGEHLDCEVLGRRWSVGQCKGLGRGGCWGAAEPQWWIGRSDVEGGRGASVWGKWDLIFVLVTSFGGEVESRVRPGDCVAD